MSFFLSQALHDTAEEKAWAAATRKRGKERERDVWEKMASDEIANNLELAGPEVWATDRGREREVEGERERVRALLCLPKPYNDLPTPPSTPLVLIVYTRVAGEVGHV